MSEIIVKLGKPRGTPERGAVDFDERDAWEWGRYAVRHGGWQATCEVGETRFGTNVEAAVAIAAPDGRVALWYGRMTLPRVTNGKMRNGRRDDTVNKHEAAYAALCDEEATNRVDRNALAAAAMWDAKRTRGGDRDVSPLAMAACRILHAGVYGDTPTLRDQLLAEFVSLSRSVLGKRPPTPHLLRASEDELLAASALLAAEEYDGARSLLARKGVTG